MGSGMVWSPAPPLHKMMRFTVKAFRKVAQGVPAFPTHATPADPGALGMQLRAADCWRVAAKATA